MNILFLFPDQWRYDWLGANPELPLRTPVIKGLQAQGMTFTKTVTPSPVCAPARACVANGREYDQCQVPSNRTNYPLDAWTVYQALRDAGYHTLGCGKFDLHKATYSWGPEGKDSLAEWGFTDGIDNEGKWDGIYSGLEEPAGPYMHFLERENLRQTHIDDFMRRRDKTATHATPLPEHAYCDNWLARNGLELLDQVPIGEPWFLQVNFTGPHEPWDITESMAQLYCDESFPPPVEAEKYDPATYNRIRANYAAMCENIDRLIGQFLAAVESRGEMDNTLIVFSSDHGEMLLDHDRIGKSVPHQPSIGVPLVIAGPGVQPGTTFDQPVSLIDLTATFLEIAGLPIPDEVEGKSLLPLLAGDTAQHRDHVQAGLMEWRLVWDGHHKLVRYEDGREHLYDIEADPGETQDLLADQPEVADRLRPLLPEGWVSAADA